MKVLHKVVFMAEKTIACTALAGIVSVSIINVICRYASFAKSIVGAEDFIQLLFCWFIFIGASACYGEGMHYGMDLVVNRLQGRVRKLWLLGINVVILFTSVFLAWQSYILMVSVSAKVTGTLRISYFYIDMAPFMAFVFMTIHAADFIFSTFGRGSGSRLPESAASAKAVGQGGEEI